MREKQRDEKTESVRPDTRAGRDRTHPVGKQEGKEETRCPCCWGLCSLLFLLSGGGQVPSGPSYRELPSGGCEKQQGCMSRKGVDGRNCPWTLSPHVHLTLVPLRGGGRSSPGEGTRPRPRQCFQQELQGGVAGTGKFQDEIYIEI